jgi:hypothetical protein
MFISSLARDWVDPRVVDPNIEDGEKYLKVYYFGLYTQFGKSTYSSLKNCLKMNLENIALCFKSYDTNSSEEVAYYTEKYTHFEVFNYYFSGYFLGIFVDVLMIFFILMNMDAFKQLEVCIWFYFLYFVDVFIFFCRKHNKIIHIKLWIILF